MASQEPVAAREQPLPDPVPIHESVWIFMEKHLPADHVKALRVAVDQAHTTHQQVHDFDCQGVRVRTCYGADPVARRYYTRNPEDWDLALTTWKDTVKIFSKDWTLDKGWAVTLHAPTGRIESLVIWP